MKFLKSFNLHQNSEQSIPYYNLIDNLPEEIDRKSF